MKTKLAALFSLCLLSIWYISCEKNDSPPNENSSVVGNIINGELTLGVDKKSELNKWEKSLAKEGIDANLDDVMLFTANGNHYMRATGNGLTSTTLLRVGDGGTLYSLGITCTSKVCATTSGCVPIDSKRCSSCWSGDCTKTVSL